MFDEGYEVTLKGLGHAPLGMFVKWFILNHNVCPKLHICMDGLEPQEGRMFFSHHNLL